MSTPTVVVPLFKNELLAAALAYATVGMHVLPCWWIENEACACGNADCKSPGKHPINKLVKHGQANATTDVETIKQWWAQYPKANIACFLEPSGLCAIDIDPRNGGMQTMANLEAIHGLLVSDLLQFSGGGGEHRVFRKPENQNLPGKLGPGVDVKLNGYIMLAPSNHISGGIYGWEVSSDPRDGCMASPLPDWIRDLAGRTTATELLQTEASSGGEAVILVQSVRDDLLQALYTISSDDRDTWVRCGMALHATNDRQWAFTTWDKWSQQSKKYDPVDQARVWYSFRSNKTVGRGNVTYHSIFSEANSLKEPKPAKNPAPFLKLEQPTAPDTLLTPPGVLGVVAKWINDTSRKQQPMFAVQAAIAFAATVMGRRFVSSNRNWSSLYLLNIGKSASGKEHAKWALESLLEACDMAHLIGPASYTSSSGLLSALYDQPSHITIIDEFGKELEQSSIKNNARAQSTMRTLIEVWGRCDGTLRPQGYSTFGMSATDAKSIKERSVRNPALSLLAMTTPETFFDTIGSAAARDGFLNRFLIVESDIGRQTSSIAQQSQVPDEVVSWAKELHLVSSGALNQVATPSIQPDPVVVEITHAAKGMFSNFDAECIGFMDKFESNGLAEMFGRTNEIAMKLAMVCAVSRGAGPTWAIEGTDAAWAIQYVRYHAQRTVDRLIYSVHDSEFEASKQQVMKLLLSKGAHGMTVRELEKSSRKFCGMNQRQQLELLNSMQFVGSAQLVSIPSSSGRGKSRNAWVATDHDSNDESAINGDKK